MLERPQIAAIATVVLVAFISLPLWLSDIGPRVQRDMAVSAPSSAPRRASLDVEAAAPPPPAAFAPRPQADESALQERERSGISEERPVAAASAGARPVERPSLRMTEKANRFLAADEASGDERQRPPSPEPASSSVVRPDREERAIIVTGTVARSPAAAAANEQQAPVFAEQSNWNACTILDSRHNLRVCRKLADPARPGRSGRAAAHFLDGLNLAWEGDLEGAIETFGRSIAASPDLSIAYLNRGLAYRLKGDTDRAMADFGRAIASDPDFAPAYYHRGQLLRKQGETARADADIERAARLARQ
jgi:hypothetical protein